MGKKDIIYKSGLDEISKRGFFNTKVQDIVDNANVSVGTFYNYYKDKTDFLYFIFLNEYTKLHNSIKHIESTDESEIDKLINFFDLLINEISSNRNAFSILFSEKQYLPKILEAKDSIRLETIENSINFMLLTIVEEGQKKNLIKVSDPYLIIVLIQSFIYTLFLKNDTSNSVSLINEMKIFIMDSITINGG